MDTKEKKRKGSAPARRKTNIRVKKAEITNNIKADTAIVYTLPKPFDWRKIALRMVSVAAVVVAFILVISIFFKVDNVTVAGVEKYKEWDVYKVSGIREGESILTLNKAKISGQITTKLPYVESVRIGIKLPDTVKIEIQEVDVVYAIADGNDKWWLMDASGKMVDSVAGSEAKAYTQIQGVRLQSPTLGEQAVAMEDVPATDEAGQTLPVTVSQADRLDAVIRILQSLEKYGVIGQADSLDVSDMTMIELWYEDRYQVLLGDTKKTDYKIECMVKAIGQQKEYQRGILDVSFTTWPDSVNLSPFSD